MYKSQKSLNTCCLLSSLKQKERQYNELKLLLGGPNKLNNQTQELEKKIEIIKNKIDLNDSSNQIAIDTINKISSNLLNLENEIITIKSLDINNQNLKIYNRNDNTYTCNT